MSVIIIIVILHLISNLHLEAFLPRVYSGDPHGPDQPGHELREEEAHQARAPQGGFLLPHAGHKVGGSHHCTALHYGLTGGWVQKFKASYLAYFLQCALTDYARGKS